jgi:adenosylcobinamide kinase/adenosylcobinamide-phosphate guanylyltransferase
MAAGRIVFVTGGTRSGKSSFALNEASRLTGRKVFVATAQAFDQEMEQRIGKHKRERGTEWETIEEPYDLARALGIVSQNHDVAVVDCLTIWLSNLMTKPEVMEEAQNGFVESLQALKKGIHLFIVSNEVGMGIVPENAMARQFRDMAGHLNQRVARVATEAYFVVAGMPVRIK